MRRFVLCAMLVGGCALGDDDGGSAADPADGRPMGADARPVVMADASSGLPDSPRPFDAPPPVDAPPEYDAAPCGTPGPDTCEAAVDLTTMATTAEGAIATGDTTLLQDTLNALDSDTCTGYDNPGHDAIYKVTANNGQMIQVTLTPDGVSYDPSVWIGSTCEAGTCVAGADSTFSGQAETVTYPVTTAGTYYIVVDSWMGSVFGCYTLNVKLL